MNTHCCWSQPHTYTCWHVVVVKRGDNFQDQNKRGVRERWEGAIEERPLLEKMRGCEGRQEKRRGEKKGWKKEKVERQRERRKRGRGLSVT